MKKGLIIILIVSLTCIISACGNNVQTNMNEEIERNDMSYKLTRARYDGDIEKIYDYTPNVFLSDELKIPKKMIQITAGHTNRLKRVEINKIVALNWDKNKNA